MHMAEEEEQVFIAQAKGRSGWGHHPYYLDQKKRLTFYKMV